MSKRSTYDWVGGEAGSATWMFLSNSLAEKQINQYTNTKNVLKLQFGQTYTQDQDTKDWNDPEKSSDLIDFESVLRFDLDTWVDPFASARIESQFQDKSDDLKTVAFNPVTLTQSVGAAKVLMSGLSGPGHARGPSGITREGPGTLRYIWW